MRWGRVAAVVGLGVLGLGVGVAGWVHRWNQCSAECTQGLREAKGIAKEGRVMEAIFVLDEVDRRCDCMRFTEGDEPPEHSAMKKWVARVCAEGGKIEPGEDGAGPILRLMLERVECR